MTFTRRVHTPSGYGKYGVGQPARLHRLLALRDLDFNLEQIGPVLDEELAVGELRGMPRMRRAQIEASLEEEPAYVESRRISEPRKGATQ